MTQPLVAVSTDVKEFENHTWHATPQQYLDAALSVAGVFPVLVPSLGGRLDFDALLASVDGLLLTGARSNVDPALYGATGDERSGPHDRCRDATTLPLIRKAVELGVPLLGICRGIQELNVAFGGTLVGELHEREGMMDHRAPESPRLDDRFAIRQKVEVKPGTCLADILGTNEILVNSVHRQGLDRLGSGLQVEAVAPDGVVEAVSVVGSRSFAMGVQWHPEYWASTDHPSRRIFQAFGDAVRAHAKERLKEPASNQTTE